MIGPGDTVFASPEGECWHRSGPHAGYGVTSWTRSFAEIGLGLRPCRRCSGTDSRLTTVVHVNHPGGFDLYCGRASRFAKNPAARVSSPWHNPFRIGACPASAASARAIVIALHADFMESDDPAAVVPCEHCASWADWFETTGQDDANCYACHGTGTRTVVTDIEVERLEPPWLAESHWDGGRTAWWEVER